MKYVCIVIAVFTLSCKTMTTPEMEANSLAITNAIANKNFIFEAITAKPLATNELNQLANSGLLPPGDNANNINLMGRGDFLRIEDSKVTASLSYYGTRRLAAVSPTNNNTGIELDGPITDFTFTENTKKKSKRVTFNASTRDEQFAVDMTIYRSGKATVFINSSKRNAINYDGAVKEFVAKE